MNKIVIAGGSGFIGSVIANHFKLKAREIVILSRKPAPTKDNIITIVWDGKTSGTWETSLEGADMLINLTGKNVNCRYHEKNKAEILNSRLNSVDALSRAFQSAKHPPTLWIQMGSATIYRHAEDRAMDEMSGEIGSGFSVEVCKAWEKKFAEQNLSCRKVLLRTSIVLGSEDGAFTRLMNLTTFGLGGHQGNGLQRISWIHEKDLVRIVEWIYEHEEISGTYNAASPDPVLNQTFMKTLRTVMKIPVGIRTPAWLLKIGAWLIGTETELVLKSRWVVPTKLLAQGFQFYFPTLEVAIKDLVQNK